MYITEIKNELLNSSNFEILSLNYKDLNVKCIIVEINLLKPFSYDISLYYEELKLWKEFDFLDIPLNVYGTWINYEKANPLFIGEDIETINFAKRIEEETNGYINLIGRFTNRNDSKLYVQIGVRRNLKDALRVINFNDCTLIHTLNLPIRKYGLIISKDLEKDISIEYVIDPSVPNKTVFDELLKHNLITQDNYNLLINSSFNDVRISHYKLRFSLGKLTASKLYFVYQ